MNIAIVKYNAGNIYSVQHALRRLGIEPVVTDDVQILRSADKVIFPESVKHQPQCRIFKTKD